jgi:dTDP-4-amino-4,6-dideoxygalactose transaminase
LLNKFEEVLDSGKYILGPNVKNFESNFASYIGTNYAVGMSNGTCTLNLGLRAIGLKPGDEVLTPANSFVASTSAIVLAGLMPVLVDVDDHLNIDPDSIEENITPATKAIMVVHLAGKPAQMNRILEIADKHNLVIVEDAAQSVGALYGGKQVGSFGLFGSFSLHPLKNLHGYGDSGIISTNNALLYQNLIERRNHGLIDRETCSFFSYNCRIDEIQAALINVQLAKLEDWTAERIRIAEKYSAMLRAFVTVPLADTNERHVYQTYVIRTQKRDKLQQHLKSHGVESIVHYRKPIHLQPAFKKLNLKHNSLINVEKFSNEILSLPIYPGLTDDKIEYVCSLITGYLQNEI